MKYVHTSCTYSAACLYVCVYVYSSDALSIPTTVTWVGRRVVLHVMEGNV